jgi:hypothetical protein
MRKTKSGQLGVAEFPEISRFSDIGNVDLSFCPQNKKQANG